MFNHLAWNSGVRCSGRGTDVEPNEGNKCARVRAARLSLITVTDPHRFERACGGA